MRRHMPFYTVPVSTRSHDPYRPFSFQQFDMILLNPFTYTYFKKGCCGDVCFIDRSASCLLNSWLLFSSYYRKCNPKTRAIVYFSDLVFSWNAFSEKAINAFIYSKHDALRSMKQGLCIMHH